MSKIRCDKPMRKRKEKLMTPLYTQWRCTGDCKGCICALVKSDDGTESHVGATR